VSLLSLTAIEAYVKISYLVIVFGIVLWGILTLAFQNSQRAFWVRNKDKISLGLSLVAALFFIISKQPYAAVFIFMLLVIKALMLIKWE
ncbi:MAG: XRE family transcriptional regulator, partial [Lachnospiraceae bacterium]|nr:XRE family transcriptional regulator [Lachnospiraceae bacterium]